MTIPSDWTPTTANINALPDPIRHYIHQLETRTDPAGDVRRIAYMRDQLEALEALYGATREELSACKADLDGLWKVKDYADGWIICSTAEALATLRDMGGAYIEPVEADAMMKARDQ